jgi:hypothetical protein
MESSDGRYVIAFTREIYNHRELRPRLSLRGDWRGTSLTRRTLLKHTTVPLPARFVLSVMRLEQSDR